MRQFSATQTVFLSFCLCCFLLFSCVSVNSQSTSLPLSSTEKQAILDAHNYFRSIVQPKALYMTTLVWDDDLATISQNYVDKCVANAGKTLVAHNVNRSMNYPTYVGENIYASTGSVTNMTSVVNAWDAEKKDYTLSTNKCKSGAVCGHYTQLVWANTTRLGCGRAKCENVKYTNNVVCNYAPGGNYNNVKPYVAFSSSGRSRSSFILSSMIALILSVLFISM